MDLGGGSQQAARRLPPARRSKGPGCFPGLCFGSRLQCRLPLTATGSSLGASRPEHGMPAGALNERQQAFPMRPLSEVSVGNIPPRSSRDTLHPCFRHDPERSVHRIDDPIAVGSGEAWAALIRKHDRRISCPRRPVAGLPSDVPAFDSRHSSRRSIVSQPRHAFTIFICSRNRIPGRLSPWRAVSNGD